MKVLLIGSGGREHALAAAIARSPLLDELLAHPGNAGIAEFARCLDCADEAALFDAIKKEGVDLVVIGPEAPLVDGLADRLNAAGVAVFGASQRAAMLEGSKAFAREFCDRHNIPQPVWRHFRKRADAIAYVENHTDAAHVVKADGLAAGKGVIVADDKAETIAAINTLLTDEDGAGVLIEERISGVEASLFAIADGTNAVFIGTAQDYKRAYDGDKGANTGGMGAVSPAPALTAELTEEAWREVVEKTIAGMRTESMPYQGFLYAGLMLTADGIKVIEFNCRFGDPEAQAILPRIEGDLLAAMHDASQGNLGGNLEKTSLSLQDNVAVVVVMANQGYPAKAVSGAVINGLAESAPNTLVFHAGTTQAGADMIASGGRVLAVAGLGADQTEARENAYARVGTITWDGVFYRRDIGG